MQKIKRELDSYCTSNRKKIADFLSKIVRIKSYSNQEKNIKDFILSYIRKSNFFSKNLRIKTVGNNILVCLKCSKNSSKSIMFDAHLDTVPVSEEKSWKYPPFSGKIYKDKVYGRGSCDDKGSITSLVFTLGFLISHINTGNNINSDIWFSFSSNEEDSSGKGIETVLNYVVPKLAVICEPSDLKIVYGHKGKLLIRVTFFGKPAHSSVPHLGVNAIYLAQPVINRVVSLSKNAKFIKPLGKPVATVSYIDSKTNSFNSVPYECKVYIDYRSVIGETKESILKKLFQDLDRVSFNFEILHRYFPAWVLNTQHPLVDLACRSFISAFSQSPELVLWPFCTNGSITMGEKSIPTIGFGPGKPQLAHCNDEYIDLEQILKAVKFYSLLALNY